MGLKFRDWVYDIVTTYESAMWRWTHVSLFLQLFKITAIQDYSYSKLQLFKIAAVLDCSWYRLQLFKIQEIKLIAIQDYCFRITPTCR
jgi:hypothetical protein